VRSSSCGKLKKASLPARFFKEKPIDGPIRMVHGAELKHRAGLDKPGEKGARFNILLLQKKYIYPQVGLTN
jgi:hypothetical protein